MHNNPALEWLNASLAQLNEQSRQSALQHQNSLTKPAGTLGRLEDLAVQLAAMQNTTQPRADRIHITVFAADHGVAAENISAFPQSVTRQMILNFASGGAAINVLARSLNAHLDIVNLGTKQPLDVSDDLSREIRQHSLGPGTRNFLHDTAMDDEQLAAALMIGKKTVEQVHQDSCQLFIGGDMGIGNTTSAAALACALLDARPTQLAGPGTGLDEQGVAHKTVVIESALDRHHLSMTQPEEALRCLGGFEIAALAGAYIRCAQLGLPVLIDGFICTVAALSAEFICPQSKQWFLYAHHSAEPGHSIVLNALDADPLLDLGMRLGEGSGAAVAVNLLRAACALHNEMATFSDAGVATRTSIS